MPSRCEGEKLLVSQKNTTESVQRRPTCRFEHVRGKRKLSGEEKEVTRGQKATRNKQLAKEVAKGQKGKFLRNSSHLKISPPPNGAFFQYSHTFFDLQW
jgi:hypothetical protein